MKSHDVEADRSCVCNHLCDPLDGTNTFCQRDTENDAEDRNRIEPVHTDDLVIRQIDMADFHIQE